MCLWKSTRRAWARLRYKSIKARMTHSSLKLGFSWISEVDRQRALIREALTMRQRNSEIAVDFLLEKSPRGVISSTVGANRIGSKCCFQVTSVRQHLKNILQVRDFKMKNLKVLQTSEFDTKVLKYFLFRSCALDEAR